MSVNIKTRGRLSLGRGEGGTQNIYNIFRYFFWGGGGAEKMEIQFQIFSPPLENNDAPSDTAFNNTCRCHDV